MEHSFFAFKTTFINSKRKQKRIAKKSIPDKNIGFSTSAKEIKRWYLNNFGKSNGSF